MSAVTLDALTNAYKTYENRGEELKRLTARTSNYATLTVAFRKQLEAMGPVPVRIVDASDGFLDAIIAEAQNPTGPVQSRSDTRSTPPIPAPAQAFMSQVPTSQVPTSHVPASHVPTSHPSEVSRTKYIEQLIAFANAAAKSSTTVDDTVREARAIAQRMNRDGIIDARDHQICDSIITLVDAFLRT